MIIGITGNSGTGKTAICNALLQNLKDKDVSILDADKIAKELAIPGKDYYKEIINTFGKTILTEDGLLNRKKLGSLVFSDLEKRKLLNKITYKYVVEEIKRRISICKSEIIVIDAPLLIESNLNNECDIVVSIIANRSVKIERICTRDNIDEELAIQRLDSQKDDDFYIRNSNYVIVNNNTNIENQAKDIIKLLNGNCYNENIVIIQENELKIMQFKKLLEYKNIIHGYTLKELDFGSNVSYEGQKDVVAKNYDTLCKYLNLNEKYIIRSHQTHTNNVKKIGEEIGIFPNELNDVDGIITDKKDRVLSLVFADCTPIFLFDKYKNIIGNIHSGWQGTMKRIIQCAINKMIDEFGCNPKDIICAIGPTIRNCHFEVDEDLKNEFVKKFEDICKEQDFVKKGEKKENKQKYYIDTVYLNKKMMERSGILEKNIIDSGICTVCNCSLMHSYRAEKENAGRSTAIICKKGD